MVGASREAADDFCRDLTRGPRRHVRPAPLHAGPIRLPRRRGSLAARGVSRVARRSAPRRWPRAPRSRCAAGGLSYLEPVVGCPGLPRALASTLERAAPGARPGARPCARCRGPGPDLATLLDEYERQLNGAQAADRAGLLFEAARLIRGREAGLAWPGFRSCCWTCASRTEAERAVVAALAGEAPCRLLTVPAGDATHPAAASRRESPGARASARLSRGPTHLKGSPL